MPMAEAFVQSFSCAFHQVRSPIICEGWACTPCVRAPTDYTFERRNRSTRMSLSHSPNPQNMVNVTQVKRSKQEQSTKQGQNSERHKRESVPVIRRSGMNAAVVLLDELRDFLGTDMMLRRDVISAISSYAHKNNLTCKHDKRKFRMDETLKRIFKTDEEQQYLLINKLVKPFIQTPVEAGPSYENRAQEMFLQYIKSRGAIDYNEERSKRDQRRQELNSSNISSRRRGDGIFRPVHIDDDLLMICGGKQVLPRPEILSRVWQYIKAHNLQDPVNGRIIHVDDDMRKALDLDVDVVDSFHLGKYISKKVRPCSLSDQ